MTRNHLIPRPQESVAPPGSRIAGMLAGSDFHDAWAVRSRAVDLPALGHFLAAVQHTPGWVNACMALRNRAVSVVGLKNLGALSMITPGKAPSEYSAGERVGIFTLFENHFEEVLLGDRDKHLDVVLSVHRAELPHASEVLVTVTTVVHVHNALGRIYMVPVRPMHRLIAPAVLAAIAQPLPRP